MSLLNKLKSFKNLIKNKIYIISDKRIPLNGILLLSKAVAQNNLDAKEQLKKLLTVIATQEAL